MIFILGINNLNIARLDLNLLLSLDVLLNECNVTKAAEMMGISQPAMSNSLRRLRKYFNDPILVRTSDGMTPTPRALELKPIVRKTVSMAELAMQPKEKFNPAKSSRIFRIMASDYTEVTLLPAVLEMLCAQAPQIRLDIMTPSDVSFYDVEQGKVDLVINRFDTLPQSFHQLKLWEDSFSCLVKATNPVLNNWNLSGYLSCKHVWVSKTGMGVGVGMTTKDVQRIGWVDEALRELGQFRDIAIFTRHYQAALMFAEQEHLIVTVPTLATRGVRHNKFVVLKRPPFEIPSMQLKMVWSPLLQHDSGHIWMRQSIKKIAGRISEWRF
mgnify:CR=1 FL=1